MKLIAIEMGRVAQAFVPDEVRPAKGVYVAEATRLISERYGFGVVSSVAESIEKGAKFNQGRLVAGNRTVNISELAVYNDGVSVTTTLNTDDAEFVLQDFFAWAKQAFGRRDPITRRVKIYESQLIIDFDSAIDDALQIFSAVGSELQHALKETYNNDRPVEFSRISFSTDPVGALPDFNLIKQELFIERRIGIPYSQNRYFSSCGLTTDSHTRLLEKFEAALKGKK